MTTARVPSLSASSKFSPIPGKRLAFDKAAQRLKAAEPELRRRLGVLKATSALGKRAVENIYSESRLPWSAWKSLFHSILMAADSPKSIAESVSLGLRKATLIGPELSPPHPTILGRATTTDRFAWHLFQEGCFATHAVARRWISNQIGKPTAGVHRKLKDVPLSNFLMWATYNRASRREDPFFEKPTSAKMLRGLLGLPRDGDKPLLLLEYTLPRDLSPLVPTIADAYAGALSYYFSVMPKSDSSLGDKAQPTTLPWQEYESFEPRPEIVHGVINGQRISLSLEELL